MIRKFFDWLEDWSLNDDNAFIGASKVLLVVAVFVLLIASPFIIAVAYAPSFQLRKDEWRCTQFHEELRLVPVGKIMMYQSVPVCDEYQRVH